MSEPRAIVIEPHPSVVWAVLQKREMDDLSVEAMQREVPAAASQTANRPVVLDLTKVEYVPSLALGGLVGLMKTLRQKGHRLVVVGVHPHVRTVLAVTRLDKLFEIHPSLEDAVKHLGGGA